MTFPLVLIFCLSLAVVTHESQPNQYWTSYALARNPDSSSTAPITFFEAYFNNPSNPESMDTECEYRIWMAITSSDELNYMEHMLHWSDENSWEYDIHYFQWSPHYDYYTYEIYPRPGDTLYGCATLDEHKYNLYWKDINSGKSFNYSFPIQQTTGGYKVYDRVYFTFENQNYDDCSCHDYPIDDKAVFTNIKIKWDGSQKNPNWTTGFVQQTDCNMDADIVGAGSVSISWDHTA